MSVASMVVVGLGVNSLSRTLFVDEGNEDEEVLRDHVSEPDVGAGEEERDEEREVDIALWVSMSSKSERGQRYIGRER